MSSITIAGRKIGPGEFEWWAYCRQCGELIRAIGPDTEEGGQSAAGIHNSTKGHTDILVGRFWRGRRQAT